MKKLKLKLEGKEMLSKDQMKKISGGYDGWRLCGVHCPNDSYYSFTCDSESCDDCNYLLDYYNNTIFGGNCQGGCEAC